jgi:hypothetical protein
VREQNSKRTVSEGRLQRYAHIIGLSTLERVLDQRESSIATALSPWLGGNDLLILSAAAYSKRYLATESDDMYDEDFTI